MTCSTCKGEEYVVIERDAAGKKTGKLLPANDEHAHHARGGGDVAFCPDCGEFEETEDQLREDLMNSAREALDLVKRLAGVSSANFSLREYKMEALRITDEFKTASRRSM